MKIFSFDAETNGLYGQAFAIGAVVTDDEKEIARYISRCPIDGKIDKWVAENVLPQIKDIAVDQKNYEAHLGAARIYNKMGQAENALNMAKKAMDIKQTGEASWAYAQACISQNRVGEAKSALEKVVEVDPSNMVAQRALGNIFHRNAICQG